MRIGRYRVTRRGYVVFGGTGVILICLIFWLVSQSLSPSLTDPKDTKTENTESGQTSQNLNTTNESNNSNQANQTASTDSVMSDEEIDEITKNISTTVYFKPDAYDLDEDYYEAMKVIVDTCLRFKNVTVVVEGHFNSKPGDVVTPFREQLAQNRADVVVAYLVSQGVDPSRIETINQGGKLPVNKDESWQEIEKNRRVVIKFKALKP